MRQSLGVTSTRDFIIHGVPTRADRLLLLVLVASTACAGNHAEGEDVDLLTIRRRPDSLVPLWANAPSDSVVAQRAGNIVFVSGRDAVVHLQAKLARYPHLQSDSALLAVIQNGVAESGWVQLPNNDDKAVERQNFLIIALLMEGHAAVRLGSTDGFAPEARLVYWGSCEMVNGKGVVLPDSTELLRTLDGWHSCFGN